MKPNRRLDQQYRSRAKDAVYEERQWRVVEAAMAEAGYSGPHNMGGGLVAYMPSETKP